MSELPTAPFERILKEAGAERVSVDAVRQLAEIIEDASKELAIEAVKLANHAGRKTVTEEDIKMLK